MSSITISNETRQAKKRVKSLADVDTKKKFLNGKWRRLCAINGCEKQAQRENLCAAHLTEAKKRKQSSESIAVSRQSSAHLTTEALSAVSNTLADLATVVVDHTQQTNLYGCSEFYTFYKLSVRKYMFYYII